MGEINKNSEDAKSKIEKIREDLERKLAALEAAKKRTASYKKSEIEKQQLEKNEELIVEDKSQEILKTDHQLDQNETVNIEDVEQSFELNDVNEEESFNQNLLFEITDSIEPIESIELEVSEEVTIEETPIISEPEQQETKIVDTTKNEIVADEVKIVKTEKSKLNYLIYGLAGLLLLLIAYFSYDYYNDSKRLKQNKLDLMISKFKNKSYLDSIELADAQNQLLDLRSQSIIDSIADINFANLESKLKTNTNNKNKPKKKKTTSTPKKINDVSNPTNNSAIVNSTQSNESTQKEDIIEKSTTNLNDNTNKSNTDNKSSLEKTEIKDEAIAIKSEDLEKEKSNITSKTKDVTKKAAVQTVAVYPGCSNKRTEADKKKCLLSKMYRYVARNFNTDLAQDLGLKDGVNKIRVSFIIDKNGKTKVLNVRTPDKRLEKEAIRVVQSMPKMTPARTNGVAKSVKYNIPILFTVEN